MINAVIQGMQEMNEILPCRDNKGQFSSRPVGSALEGQIAKGRKAYQKAGGHN